LTFAVPHAIQDAPSFVYGCHCMFMMACLICIVYCLQILEAFARAEQLKKPSPVVMFDDVYSELPTHLQHQRDELKQHLTQYGDHYALDNFEPFD